MEGSTRLSLEVALLVPLFKGQRIEAMTTEGREAYNQWATQYDTDANATRDLNAKVLREQACVQGADDVLEIGSGTGLNTQWFVERAGSVVAVDFSSGILGKAQTRLSGRSVIFQKMDVRETWPFGDETFDYAESTPILERVEVLGMIIREAHRVLRECGVFYLSELHPYRQMERGAGQRLRRRLGRFCCD